METIAESSSRVSGCNVLWRARMVPQPGDTMRMTKQWSLVCKVGETTNKCATTREE